MIATVAVIGLFAWIARHFVTRPAPRPLEPAAPPPPAGTTLASLVIASADAYDRYARARDGRGQAIKRGDEAEATRLDAEMVRWQAAYRDAERAITRMTG